MSSNFVAIIRDEVEALHQFFVGWFTGALQGDAFEPDFLARFDPESLLIPPAGVLLLLDEFASSVRRGHQTNPDFRIAIRNVRIRRRLDGQILATYEEWQRNAFASTPPDNARIATVLFTNSRPLKWLHIHETWMPESAISEGSFDF